MKRRLSTLFLVTTLAISLAACGSTDESESSTTTSVTSMTSSSKSSTSKTSSSSSVASSTSSEPTVEPEPTVNEDADTQIHGFIAPQEEQPDPVAPAPDPVVVEQQAPAPDPAPVPAPAPVYEAPAPAPAPEAPAVGTVHPGSFCSGGTGVSKKGVPMVCAPGSDGRNRWQSA